MSAARIASTFNMDPITVLDADDDLWLIRVACARVIARDQAEQVQQMKQG